MTDPTTQDWMGALAAHYEAMRTKYPDDRLLVMFDIDGTIIDIRYVLLYVLQAYDRAHQTVYFRKLTLDQINVSENQVDLLLRQLPIPQQKIAEIGAWFVERRWSPEAIALSHRPFRGVLEVIRWFQLQPNTFVGLNTGRPETIRAETLRSLNTLGDAYRVTFSDDLLFMNPGDWDSDVLAAKVAGVRYFEKAGYRVVAFIDNEPQNLEAVAQADPDHEILILHASTIFESQREKVPGHAVSGESYDLTALLSAEALPEKIQFVWHAVNTDARIRQFLDAGIHWGEFDIRKDPVTGNIVCRRYSLQGVPPLAPDESMPLLSDTLATLKAAGKGIKLDLRDGAETLDEVIGMLAESGYPKGEVWFHGRIERLLEDGFRRLSLEFPASTVQCSIDFLAPLIIGAPAQAKELLAMLSGWGINRFSVRWQTLNKRQILKQMDAWGYDVNIFDIPNLRQFLKAALLRPKSITADFIPPDRQKSA